MPSSDLCPADLRSGSIRIREASEKVELRRIRDTVLKGTFHGKGYLAALQNHKPEIIRIIASNPAVLKSMDRLLDAVRIDFAEGMAGKLSKTTAACGKQFLAALSGKAGPRLTAVCGGIAEDLDALSGKEVRPLLVARPLPKKPAPKKPPKRAITKKRK
jgi:hypothetical protein